MSTNVKIFENTEIHILDNGITLIMEHLSHYSTSAITFFLKSGSRDETDNESGYSHFVEHMLFKGTLTEGKLSLSEKFDHIGGHINAYTSQEEIVIYNLVPSIHLEESLLLMTDMFNNSIMDQQEINLEKDVIINELNMINDDPQEKILEDFFQNIFPDSGLGRPIIGIEKSIKTIDSQKLTCFYNNTFSGNNLIISIAGNCNTDRIKNIVAGIQFRKTNLIHEDIAMQTKKQWGFTKMSSELIHVLSGRVLYKKDPQFYFRISLLNMILGGSMSSRLFQKIRDNLGLCYTINSDIDHFRNETIFSVYYSVMPSKLEKTAKTIQETINEIIVKGITEEELYKVKKQKIGQMILSSDQLTKRMNSNLYYNLYYKNAINKNDAIKIISETNVSDINEIISLLFSTDSFTQLLYKKKPKDALWKL